MDGKPTARGVIFESSGAFDFQTPDIPYGAALRSTLLLVVKGWMIMFVGTRSFLMLQLEPATGLKNNEHTVQHYQQYVEHGRFRRHEKRTDWSVLESYGNFH